MAGNFWQSSHYTEWLLLKPTVSKNRQTDFKVFSEEEYQKVMIFYANLIQTLGEKLPVRQQVIATATVYFKRFYSRYSLKCVDPWLLSPTTLVLASKVEEYGVLSNKALFNMCQNLVKNKYSAFFINQEYPYKLNHLLECEFVLLEILDCCLVVYHPYRSLTTYVDDICSTNPSFGQDVFPVAWRVINDSLRTDVCLLYPPFMIALAALQIASSICGKDVDTWFAELSVDLDKVLEIVKHLMALYELLKKYDEQSQMPEILGRCPKPKLDGRGVSDSMADSTN